jgi:cytoskeletal protein CcmA (bactofilin family)
MSGTRISEDMTIEGDLSCSGPLEVWGKIDGDVVAGKLEIMTGGRVEGTVEADELVVRGEHVGSAICSAVMISADAIVQSRITAKTLACEAGATISGNFQVAGEVSPPDAANAVRPRTERDGVVLA